jgi:hypothetical protein
LGLRSLFAEPEESGRRTGSSEEPVHLLLHRVKNLLERRLVIDRLRAASELPLGLAKKPGVAQTRLRLIIIDSDIPGRTPRAPWLEAVASERLAFFSHRLPGGAALSGGGLSVQLYFGRGTSVPQIWRAPEIVSHVFANGNCRLDAFVRAPLPDPVYTRSGNPGTSSDASSSPCFSKNRTAPSLSTTHTSSAPASR